MRGDFTDVRNRPGHGILRVFSLSLMVSALTRLPQLAAGGDLVFETGFVLLPAVIEAAAGCLLWLCAPSISNRTVPADAAAPSRVAFSFDSDQVVATAVLLMGIFMVVDVLSRLAGSLVSMGLEQRAGGRFWTDVSLNTEETVCSLLKSNREVNQVIRELQYSNGSDYTCSAWMQTGNCCANVKLPNCPADTCS